MKGEEMSAKVLLIEKCEDCINCCPDFTQFYDLIYECDITSKEVDPDSLPPDDCPLIDLDEVVEEVKADCIKFMIGGSYIAGHYDGVRDAIDAFVKALKGA